MAQVFIGNWLLFTLAIRTGVKVYHFTWSYRIVSGGPPSDSQLLSLATTFYNIIAPGLANVLNNTCTMITMTVRDMSSALGHEAVYTPTTPTVGAVVADPEPGNVAATLTYTPATVGKGVKGRTFVSGLGDTGVAAQVFTSAVVNALANVASAYRVWGGTGGINLFPAVASRAHVLLRDIVATTVTNQVNNQIRRLINHKRHKRHPVTP